MNTVVSVEAVPLMNAVDTTNGYVLDKEQIQSIPLPTGSFTGLAILSPGVNAELQGGTGALSGLGNAPIWANGQRDTSNSFSLNGVDASNLFNGKSTSQVASARVINSTGASTSTGGGGVIQTTASVYLSIGNAIPTPAPETIEEVRVNASMYDAQQGSTSGAHIDMSTSSGTNAFHGTVYGMRATNWINAAPFFFKNDPVIISTRLVNPELHRYMVGGTFGGPIIKNKLFGFVSYQHLQVSDQEIGDSFLDVPRASPIPTVTRGLFANIVNNNFGHRAGFALTATSIAPHLLCLIRLRFPANPASGLYPTTLGWSLSPSHLQRISSWDWPFQGRHGCSEHRLQRHIERHHRAEVLLPARSHPCSLRLLERSRIHRAPRLWRAGLLHHQHLPRQAQPQHHANPRLYSREDLEDNEQPFGPKANSRAVRSARSRSTIRLELLPRRLHRECARRCCL